jgi:hypothetical protein
MSECGFNDNDISLLVATDPLITGRFLLSEGGDTAIRIRATDDNAKLAMLISHEVFHVVSFILDRAGMKLVLEVSDEAYAYLIGYITSEIYKKLKL